MIETTTTPLEPVDLEHLEAIERRRAILDSLKQCTGTVNAAVAKCEGSAISRIKEWATKKKK